MSFFSDNNFLREGGSGIAWEGRLTEREVNLFRNFNFLVMKDLEPMLVYFELIPSSLLLGISFFFNFKFKTVKS